MPSCGEKPALVVMLVGCEVEASLMTSPKRMPIERQTGNLFMRSNSRYLARWHRPKLNWSGGSPLGPASQAGGAVGPSDGRMECARACVCASDGPRSARGISGPGWRRAGLELRELAAWLPLASAGERDGGKRGKRWLFLSCARPTTTGGATNSSP